MTTFLAMNRFTVTPDNAEEFEKRWLSRESKLHEFQGFIEFHVLKGKSKDGNILFISHTAWKDEESFNAWFNSDYFREVHSKAKTMKKLHEGHPEVELLTSVQHIKNY